MELFNDEISFLRKYLKNIAGKISLLLADFCSNNHNIACIRVYNVYNSNLKEEIKVVNYIMHRNNIY